MAVINFTPRNFTLLVGDYNVTAYTSEINITRSRPELGKWVSWSGSITLDEPANTTGLPESFDDLDNAPRWLPANHPVILTIDGQRICTLRIADYRWDEIERRAVIEVQDLLTLLNGQDPPLDYQGLGFSPNAGATVKDVVVKLLDLAGLPGGLSGVPARGSFPVAPDHRSGGFIAAAAKILSERGQYLHLDKLENPAIVDFYGQTVSSDALYYWGGIPGQTELEIFEREKSPRWGYSVVECRGTGRKFAQCGADEDWVIEQEAIRGSRKYIALREEFSVISDTQRERITQLTRYMPRIEAFPGRFFSSSNYGLVLLKVAVIQTREQFDSQGRLTRRIVNTSARLGILAPNPFGKGSESKPDFESGREGERWIEDGETVTTIYREYPTGAVTGTFYIGLSPGPLREVDEVKQKTYALTRQVEETRAGNRVTQTTRIVEASEATDLAGVFIRKLTGSRKIEQWIENPQVSSPMGDNVNETPTDGSCCDRFDHKLYEFERRVFRNQDENEGLLLVNTKVESGQTPPAWTTRKPDAPVCDFPLEAIATMAVAGESEANPLKGTRKAVVGFDTLNRQSEANEFLDFTVRRLQGQGRNRQIVGPVRDWFINRPDPCNRVRVNREEFVVVGESLLIRPEEMSLGFVGEFVGTCPPVPAPATAERSNYVLGLGTGTVPVAEPRQSTVRINMPLVGSFSLIGVENLNSQIQMINPLRFDLSSTPIPLTVFNVSVPQFALTLIED